MRNLDAKWFIHKCIQTLQFEKNSSADQLLIPEFAHCPEFAQKEIADLKAESFNREFGFLKSVGKFWKKHKVPILIGAGVAAAVGTIIVVSVFTGGAAAGIAAAAAAGAGAAALDKKNSESKPENSPPPQNVASKPPEPTPFFTPIPECPSAGGLWVSGQYYPYISDQKSSDFQFISSLPQDFRHNLAVQSIGTISSTMQMPWNAQTRLAIPPPSLPALSKPCINPPPILPSRFPLDSFQSNSVLQAMGKEIVNNPWLLNPVPDPTLQPTTPLGETLSMIGKDLASAPNPTETLQNAPWYTKTFSSISNALETIGKGIADSPTLFNPDSPKQIEQIPVTRPNVPYFKKAFTSIQDAFNHIGTGVVDAPTLFDPNPAPPRLLSSSVTILGSLPSIHCMSLITGMNTLEFESKAHVDYIAKFAPGVNLDWVYNRTHGAITDLTEIFALNYAGFSPNTADALLENWTRYDEQHRDMPGVKYFQECHSQAAIHVKNALMKAPLEIRNRVIVLAIAPALVVPRELCYNSFNYACESDLVPIGELVFAALAAGNLNFQPLVEALKHRKELILLKEPEDSPGWNHDFQSPIFKDKIERHIQDYLKTNGNYK